MTSTFPPCWQRWQAPKSRCGCPPTEFMHDLSDELRALAPEASIDTARAQALRLEGREVFSVRSELLITLYIAVATLVAGAGRLVKANLDRIGPVALLSGIFAASALCYALAMRPRRPGHERSLGLDYVLLLGALLFSTAVAYAEVQFHLLGAGWSRHLLLLAAWHLVTAYLFQSRLLLSVALTAFAGWLGVEARLGTAFDPLYPMWGAGPRSLLCALVFWPGSRFHVHERAETGSGFRDVLPAVRRELWLLGRACAGRLSSTRWIGAVTLLVLAMVIGRAGPGGKARELPALCGGLQHHRPGLA